MLAERKMETKLVIAPRNGDPEPISSVPFKGVVSAIEFGSEDCFSMLVIGTVGIQVDPKAKDAWMTSLKRKVEYVLNTIAVWRNLRCPFGVLDVESRDIDLLLV